KQTELIASKVTESRDALRLDLAALDRALFIYDPAIDPDAIAPVHGWAGKRGERGALRKSVSRVLKDYAPDWVSTVNIESLVTLDLGLVFEFHELRNHWYACSFRSTLKKLVIDGLAEKEEAPSELQYGVGRWRWKQEVAPTLAELRMRR